MKGFGLGVGTGGGGLMDALVLLVGEREAVAGVDEGVEHDGREVDVVCRRRRGREGGDLIS